MKNENNKIVIRKYEELIASIKENLKNKNANKEELAKDLKHLKEQQAYLESVDIAKVQAKLDKINDSVPKTAEEKLSNKAKLEKYSFVLEQKEIFAKKAKKIESVLEGDYEVVTHAKRNYKFKKFAAYALVATFVGSLFISCGKATTDDSNSGYVQEEDTEEEKPTEEENTEEATEEATETAKNDEKDTEEKDSKKDSKDDKETKNDETGKTNTGGDSSAPTSTTSVTPNSEGTNPSAKTPSTTTTVQKEEPENVPTEGKLPVEPSTETDDSTIPTITPGKKEEEEPDKDYDKKTNDIDETGGSDNEKTKFQPEEKETEPEGKRTDYQDQDEDHTKDNPDYEKDITVIDETGGSDSEITYDIPTSNSDYTPAGTRRDYYDTYEEIESDYSTEGYEIDESYVNGNSFMNNFIQYDQETDSYVPVESFEDTNYIVIEDETPAVETTVVENNTSKPETVNEDVTNINVTETNTNENISEEDVIEDENDVTTYDIFNTTVEYEPLDLSNITGFTPEDIIIDDESMDYDTTNYTVEEDSAMTLTLSY